MATLDEETKNLSHEQVVEEFKTCRVRLTEIASERKDDEEISVLHHRAFNRFPNFSDPFFTEKRNVRLLKKFTQHYAENKDMQHPIALALDETRRMENRKGRRRTFFIATAIGIGAFFLGNGCSRQSTQNNAATATHVEIFQPK